MASRCETIQALRRELNAIMVRVVEIDEALAALCPPPLPPSDDEAWSDGTDWADGTGWIG